MAIAQEITTSGALKGIAAVASGVFIFTLVDAVAKWLGGAGYHPTQIVLMRHSFGLVPVALAIWLSRGAGLRTTAPVAHLVRGLLMCGALLQFFWGLKYMPLAEAMAVAFTAPLFITILSVLVLRETVGLHRWGAVAVGFIGMLIILRPGFGTFRPEALLIVSAALTFAFGVVFTRRMTATETNTAIFTYTTIVSILAIAPFGLATWQPPENIHLGMFVIVGLLGGLAHFLVIVAYRHAPAAVNSPFEYTGLIWGSILGWIIWQEAPDLWVWVGAGIIVLAGLYITYREAVLARAVDGAMARTLPPR